MVCGTDACRTANSDRWGTGYSGQGDDCYYCDDDRHHHDHDRDDVDDVDVDYDDDDDDDDDDDVDDDDDDGGDVRVHC